MMSVVIEQANSVGDRWAAWALAGLLDSALLLALIALIWLVIRRRVAPQVGCWLFLMVPLKLLVPLVVAAPDAVARWTPSARLASWLETAPATGVNQAPPAPVARNEGVRPRVESPAVKGLDPVAPARTMATASTSSIQARSVETAAAPVAGTPRLKLAAVAMLAWLGCVLVLAWRMVRVQGGVRARLRRLPSVDPASLSVDWPELCRLAGVSPITRVVEDDSIAAPGVWGIFRPTVILPQGIGSALTTEQLRWVLLHELAHVRRCDLVVVAWQRVATIVQFFNPSAWVAARMVDRLREYACDDLATCLGRSSAVETGEAFVKVLRHAGRGRRGLGGALGVFGLDSRAACVSRVRRLLDADRTIRVAPGPWSIAGLILLAAFALPRVRAAVEPTPAVPQQAAQAPAPREFELTVVGPGGKPVPEAAVEIRGDHEPTVEQVRRGKFIRKERYGSIVHADAKGIMLLAFPREPARFDLHITIPGYGPYWTSWSSEDHGTPIPARFTAELDRGWSVGGVVVDPEGKPIKGARVHPSIEFKKRPGVHSQFGSGAYATTDEAGRWRYDSVPDPMADVHVAIDHPAFSPFREHLPRAGFGIEAGKAPTARIVLAKGLAIIGRVLDEDGRPIVGALVRTKFSNEIRKATTGEDGTYRLAGCEERATRVVVSAKGKATDLKELNVQPDMAPVDFRMKPGGTVRVRVLDHDGKPAARARIFFQRWRGRFDYFEFNPVDQYTDADGSWVWHEAPLDEFRADICPPNGDGGMQLLEQPLIAREAEYVFRLPASLVISGRAFDAETKEPIQKFRVVAGMRFSETNLHWVETEGFQVTDGRYQVRQERGYPAHLIRVEADGYLASVSRDIQSTEGSVTVDFDLKRGRRVGVKVVTPDLKPAAGAKAALGVAGSQINIKNGDFDDGGTYCQRATSDEAGRFQFPAQAKDFQVLITHPTGFAKVNSTPEWGPERVIRLEPWARLEGTFKVGPAPAANVQLWLNLHDHDSYGEDVPRIFNTYYATTGPDGRFAFSRVIPGRGSIGRRIIFMVNEGATEVTSSRMVAVDLPAGKTVTLDLGGTGRAVVGKFEPVAGVDPKTVRWNFATIWTKPEPFDPPATGLRITATVARDGTFRIDDVPEGRYTMMMDFDRGRDAAGSLPDHPFQVPPAGNDRGPVDLGTVKLKAAAP